MIRMSGIAVLSLLLPAAAQTNHWAAVEHLALGANVQVRLRGPEPLRGRFESATGSTIVLNVKNGQRMLERQDVLQVAVRKPGHRGRNALIGLAIGTGAGVALAAAAVSGSGGFFKARAIPPVVGAPAALGTLIGAALPTGGWRTVYESR